MKVALFLLRSSRSAPAAFAVAVLLGLLGGLAGSALLHVITLAVKGSRGIVIVAFVALCATRVVFDVVSHARLSALTSDFVGALRLRLADAVVSVPYVLVERVGIPRLIGALSMDAETLGEVADLLVRLAVGLSALAGGLAYLTWLSPVATLGAVTIFSIGGLIYQRLAVSGNALRMQAMRHRFELFQSFEGAVFGTSELKLHAPRRRALFDESFEPALVAMHRNFARALRLIFAGQAVGESSFFLVVAGALVLLSLFGSDAHQGFAVALVIVYLQGPFYVVLRVMAELARVTYAVDDLEEMQTEMGAAASAKDQEAPPTPKTFSTLEARGVRFTYEDDASFALGPVDLQVRPGEIVFIVGGNGSGKSTLAKVLVGLYEPTAGAILVDGKRIDNEAHREAYRQLFAVVFADGYVFDELWGVPRETVDSTGKALLDKLGLAGKVRLTAGAFSTTDLSQGQRKRLALATAYLEDRPIFVFDEWAAEQDPTFKEYFYKQLLPEIRRAGKAAIVISHDDRYYEVADRILRLERGVAPSLRVEGKVAV